MALKKNHECKINYNNDRLLSDESFKNIFPNFENPIEKTAILENAYIMIKEIEGGKDLLKFNVFVFNDENKNCVIERRTYEFIPEISETSYNFIKQAYIHLKTLDEYDGAVDC